jgi:CRP-like cAMP-binding protein
MDKFITDKIIQEKKIKRTLLKRISNRKSYDIDVINNLKNYYMHKKLKSDSEIQILRISQFLNSFPINYKFINSSKEDIKYEFNLKEIIRILRIPPENREKKDILKLLNFFVSIGLDKILEFPNFSEKIIEKLILYFCINSKLKLVKRNSILYEEDDTFDKFYILIDGNIGIYKLVNKTVTMSGFNYFQYIYNLYIKNEHFLLKKILNENYGIFPIEENMMHNLNINLANYIINICRTNEEYLNIFNSKEDILKMCYIIDQDFPETNLALSEKENQLYGLLSKKKDKNDIIIYEFKQDKLYKDKEIIDTLNNSEFIYNFENNNSYEFNKNRNCSSRAVSQSYLCYIDLPEYIYYFIEEYKLYMHEQAIYLLNNFIFQKAAKHFESNYFKFFEFEEIQANNYLFKETDKVEYIYLLKEGIVELSINKNIFKIHELIKKLKNLNDEKSDTSSNNIKISLRKELNLDQEENVINNENKNEKLIIIEKNEIIGLECVFLGINYFYNAKLGNKNSKFYRIKVSNFMEILEAEQITGINQDYQKEAQRKINFFLLRLINLTKVKINSFKIKKIHNFLNLYNKVNLGRNIRNVKLNFTYKKPYIKLKEIRNGSVFQTNNNNITNAISNDKNESSYNIFELTNQENNFSNKSDFRKSKNRKITIKNLKNIFQNQRKFNNIKGLDSTFENKKMLVNERNMTEFNLNKYNDNELLKNNKSVPKIKIEPKEILCLKKEEILINNLNKKLSNDNLFFTKIKTNINKFNNKKLIENIKTLKSNHSYSEDIYDNWRSFHLNIYIDHKSNKKKLERINWYKNIDKFNDYDEEKNDVKSKYKLVYGIQVDKKKVAFVEDKYFQKK